MFFYKYWSMLVVTHSNNSPVYVSHRRVRCRSGPANNSLNHEGRTHVIFASANTKRSRNVGLMLGHRLGRWPSIKPTLRKFLFGWVRCGDQWVSCYYSGLVITGTENNTCSVLLYSWPNAADGDPIFNRPTSDGLYAPINMSCCHNWYWLWFKFNSHVMN